MTSEDIEAEVGERVREVRSRIDAAAQRAGRDPQEVTLVGVTKRQPLLRIAAAVRAGVHTLGENYIQEARDKQPALEALLGHDPDLKPHWRMIGRLQRNKARHAVELFEAVETLDRPELAVELDKRARAADRCLDVLIQVNLSQEAQKAGVDETQLAGLLETCADLANLRVVGLMTLPAADQAPEARRAVFAQLRELRDGLRSAPGGRDLADLSMGMSDDFEQAIEEGATLVRVGTALLGEREASRPG